MSFPWPAAINFLPNNASTSPTIDVHGAAMSHRSSNVQASIEASQPASIRTQRPTNPSMDTSAWNAPYGNAQPMNVGGQPSRNVQRQLSQSPLPAAACDFQRLSSRINPFHADFQRGQHSAANRAPGSSHSRRTGRQESLQPTPRLQNPNAQASQQLGHQRNLHRHQQAAGMTSGDYLDNRGSSRSTSHVPSIHQAPELAPDYLDPSFFHNRRVPNRSHFHTGSPHARSARTQLEQGSLASLSGTGKKSTGTQPCQGKVPVHEEDSQGSRGTEEVCQMDGQLFHRTHPKEKWGKSFIYLWEDHSTDDSPVPAVNHSAIFSDLLQRAKRSSRYRKCLYLQSFALVS